MKYKYFSHNELMIQRATPPFIGRLYDRDIGTVRTRPESYYVATIWRNKISGYHELEFEGLEANTKDINQQMVCKWFERAIKE